LRRLAPPQIFSDLLVLLLGLVGDGGALVARLPPDPEALLVLLLGLVGDGGALVESFERCSGYPPNVYLAIAPEPSRRVLRTVLASP